MLADIKNAVDGISSFPVDAEKPTVYKVKPQSTAQWVGLTGDVGLNTLKTYAEKIEDDMLASGVISQVKDALLLPPLPSLAVTVALKEPETVATPEISPVAESMLNPSGSPEAE